MGGLLGTLPTTIVPAALGIWAASPEPDTFARAMWAVPVGMLVDAGFLYVWRVGPKRMPSGPLPVRLVAMVALSLGVWLALASAGVAVLAAAEAYGWSSWAVGAGALATNVLVGALACLRPVSAPPGDQPVSAGMLVGRGVLAAMAVGVATVLAWTGDGFLSGIAAVFPAIFLTTMVGLWVSQGAAVPAGAVGPMMLGASSVGAFALAASATFPMFGATLGTVAAWLLAAVLITLPALVWLRQHE